MVNILLVDDEGKICEFVKAYLDKEGYNVDIAYNGSDCIDYLEKNKYNLVILDRMLPDISGEEICSFIKNEYINPNLPIIMLTAKIEDEDKIEGFNLGCDDYITKPFNVKELVLRVKAVLKRTNTEYKLLVTMALNPRKIFTREELLKNVVDDHCEKFDRVIDSHMKNLRQKIEVNLKDFKIIQTVYGVGYKFDV